MVMFTWQELDSGLTWATIKSYNIAIAWSVSVYIRFNQLQWIMVQTNQGMMETLRGIPRHIRIWGKFWAMKYGDMRSEWQGPTGEWSKALFFYGDSA